jgi:SAM-dependent methyltransferase
MVGENLKIIRQIDKYYSAKICEFGQSPLGVDWNGADSQLLRFQQLLRVMEGDSDFSVADVGCGYGALLDVLPQRFEKFRYTGIDISAAMIRAATERYGHLGNVDFLNAKIPSGIVDYCVASGIFNVKSDCSNEKWLDYIYDELRAINGVSLRGFSFNCLTSYSEVEKKRDYLYYADPCVIFEWCKRNCSRQVALLHDYGLFEFTILVRKN